MKKPGDLINLQTVARGVCSTLSNIFDEAFIFYMKTGNCWMPLTAFAKSFIAHIWQKFTHQECPENYIIVLVNRKEALNRYREFAG